MLKAPALSCKRQSDSASATCAASARCAHPSATCVSVHTPARALTCTSARASGMRLRASMSARVYGITHARTRTCVRRRLEFRSDSELSWRIVNSELRRAGVRRTLNSGAPRSS
eukprot:15470590-Alexandrium_andersonii.AAC.1